MPEKNALAGDAFQLTCSCPATCGRCGHACREHRLVADAQRPDENRNCGCGCTGFIDLDMLARGGR